jgi:hypothetical protein
MTEEDVPTVVATTLHDRVVRVAADLRSIR